MKILVIEDDDALRNVLVRALGEAGHVVDSAADGIEGETLATDPSYDAVVLDVMLPGRDGFAVVRALRAASVRTPVLMLTARDTVDDTIAGLNAGADDYLRKPFAIGELEARLRTIARRVLPERPAQLVVGSVAFDPATRRATRDGRTIELTSREAAFLEYFLRNAGRVVTREMIVAALWPLERDFESNVIDVYVRRLRTKLHAPDERPVLHTVRGMGYRFGE